MKPKKKHLCLILVWLAIFSIGLVKKGLQNDTFYTIKVGEWILKNGIDMMDHFSFHANLAYTYPHWLYDVFIYLIYANFGFTGIYISSIVFLFILLILVFKCSAKICNNYFTGLACTLIVALTISTFVTARAQLISFILFVLEIYFIESFLKNKNKWYLVGLLFISLLICNIHVAVWAFYFIVYLPYLVEYAISLLITKINIPDNKVTNFFKKRIIVERNDNIKYLFGIMLLSIFTGFLTPIGTTPYTYLIKTMLGDTQKYINEHQMMKSNNIPFPLIITIETLFFMIFSKVKLRDLFMISGLLLMAVFSVRHLALLAIIGTICFSRIFQLFLDKWQISFSSITITKKKKHILIFNAFFWVIVFSGIILYAQRSFDYIDKHEFPVEAVKYIKDNIDISEMRLFNDYDFGSYLILNDIPVFIDSRADLYTKQFSGFDYDIFLDSQLMHENYQVKFDEYNITHVLISKNNSGLYSLLQYDDNYKVLYEDNDFVFYEKVGSPLAYISYIK